MSYPKMMYHPHIGATIVNDAVEMVELSPDWSDKPPKGVNTIAEQPPVVLFNALPASAKAKTKDPKPPKAPKIELPPANLPVDPVAENNSKLLAEHLAAQSNGG